MQTERERLLHQLVETGRTVGQLETKLQGLGGPKGDSPK
jgi:hypothetical protein